MESSLQFLHVEDVHPRAKKEANKAYRMQVLDANDSASEDRRICIGSLASAHDQSFGKLQNEAPQIQQPNLQ